MTTRASTIEPLTARSSAFESSLVSSRMSYPRLRAWVTIPVTICMMTWTSTPLRSGACSPMTFVEREASDRAPACGLKPRLAIASSTRSRVS